MHAFFPTLVEADETDGGYGAIVVGTPVLGQGETIVEALEDAAESLQELVWTSLAKGEPVPQPGRPTPEECARGQISLLQITLPAVAA